MRRVRTPIPTRARNGCRTGVATVAGALLLAAALLSACGFGGKGNGAAGPGSPSLSPAPTPPPTAAVAAIGGTWVVQQALSSTEVDPAAVETALSTPGIRGYSLRVPWKALTGGTALLDQGLAAARKHNVAFSIRFMAGQWTPPSVFAAGSPSYTAIASGVNRVPTPFTSSGAPNAVFETAYDAEVSSLAGYCRSNGIHLLHLPWYGLAYAELNNGFEVRSQPGYSYPNWLKAHEDLVDIAARYAGPDLVVEFPLTGYGPLSQAVNDLSNYIAGKGPNFFVQANGLGPQSYGMSDFGTSNQGIEKSDDTTWGKPVGRGEQMIEPGDFNWDAIFARLRANRAHYVEIYAGSFSPSLAHHGALLADVKAFTG